MCRVLVAEDGPVLRMLAIEMLENAGHNAVDFGTAADTIAYCDDRAHDIDGIVTDINIPGDLGGLDLARHRLATTLLPCTRFQANDDLALYTRY